MPIRTLDSRYQLLRPLGRGALGEVFLAEDLHEPGRHLAAKMLSAERVGDAALQDVRRSFAVLQGLKHPNVVRLHDLGLDTVSGTFYVTMDWVDGESLRALVERGGPLGSREAVDVLVQLCRTLQFMHGRGFVHTDINPGNVMLEYGAVRILDFGLARLADSRTTHTVERRLRGTLAYTAPETLRDKVDRRTDLYAVGVVIAELVTGRRFVGDTASTHEILDLLSNKESFLRRQRDVLAGAGTRGLRDVLTRMTAFQPSDRYPSGASVILALNAALGRADPLETKETRRAYVQGEGFVGRARELERLTDAAANPGSAARIHLLRGGRGIGKTRTLAEFANRGLVNGHHSLFVNCSTLHRRPFAAAAALAGEALGNASTELIATHGPMLRVLLPSHRRLAHVPRAVLPDAGTARTALTEQIASFLRAYAREKHAHRVADHVILCVDALGAADRGSLDVLAELAFTQSSPDSSALLRLFASVEDDPPEHVERWLQLQRGKGRIVEFPLAPLTDEETGDALCALFGPDSVGHSIREASADFRGHTGGSPLLLRETVRLLVEQGGIAPTARGWALEMPLARIAPPRSSAELSARKIAQLGLNRAGVHALELLATLGRDATAQEFATLLSGRARDHAAELLHDLEERELLLARGSMGRVRYSFASELVRRALVNRVAQPRDLHHKLGQWLETQCDDDDSLRWHAGELALHFDRGRDPVKARRHYALAADDFEMHGDFAEALRILDRLLELTPAEDAEERMAVQLRRARLLERLGSWEPGVDAASEARRLATQLENAPCTAEAARVLGRLQQHRGDYERAAELYRESLEVAEQAGDALGVSRALDQLGAMRSADGAYEEALTLHVRQQQIADQLGNTKQQALALGRVGVAQMHLGRLDAARASFERKLTLCELAEDRKGLAEALHELGAVHGQLGQYDRAAQYHVREREHAQAVGDKRALARCLGDLGVVYWYQGRHTDSLECYRRQLVLAEELEDLRTVATVSGHLGELYARTGKRKKAHAAYERALELCESLGLHFYLASNSVNAAQLCHDEGLADDADRLARRALQVAEEAGDFETRVTARCLLARIEHGRARDDAQRAAVVDSLQSLLSETSEQDARARILKLQWALGGSVEHGRQALDLYMELYRRRPTEEFRGAAQELEDALPLVEPTGEVVLGGEGSVPLTYLRELLDISNQLSRRVTTGQLLEEILDLTVSFVSGDRGLLLVPAEEGDLRPSVARGAEGISLPPAEQGYSAGVIDRVCRNLEFVFTPYREGVTNAARAATGAAEIRSVLCLPLLRPEQDTAQETPRELLGVLYVESTSTPDAEQFHGQSLEFVQALAENAATALATSHGQGQLEERVAHKLAALERTKRQLEAEVSERRRVERALRDAMAQAELANRAKSAFLANMSHEIRTPLSGVIGMTEILLDTDLSGEQREFAETVASCGQSLMEILNDVLDFSKIEAGRVELERIEFSLLDTVEEVVSLMASRAEDKNLELLSYVDPEVPALVSGDPVRVRQVLTNLVGNAIKFTESGEVRVEVIVQRRFPGGAEVRLTVHDTGIGLKPEDRDRIFDAFSQADSSTTRQFGGTGLGLAISRRLVEAMGGELDADGVADEGSRFFFTLPFSQVVRQQALEPLRNAAGTPHRVLCVGPSESIQHMLKEYLAMLGLAVDHAEYPEGALATLQVARAEGRPFQLVVQARTESTSEGPELLQMLREGDQPFEVPLMSVSWIKDRYTGPTHGAAELYRFVRKPVRRGTLLDDVRGMIVGATDTLEATALAAGAQEGDATRVAPRVLVAEDNAVIRQVARRLVERLGYQVETVNDGTDAVEACRQRGYVAVLMDCQMPQMSGVDATRLIREEEAEGDRVPIIAVSASASPEERERCLAAGMDSYLPKPLDSAGLKSELDRFAPADAPVG